jgi:acetyl-CoA acetyltransferase
MAPSKGNRSTAIVGVGQSRILRSDDVPLGILAVEAAREAIADAGLTPNDIDGVAAVPDQPYKVPYEASESDAPSVEGINLMSVPFMLRSLGLKSVRWGVNVDVMFLNSVVEAVKAVEAGACNYALVYRALHNPGGVYGQLNKIDAAGPAQFRAPYGLYPPGRCGWMWHAYQDRYGTGSREEMAPFVVRSREMGIKSGEGYWFLRPDKPMLSIDDYMNARMVSTPLCLYDCDIPIQACGAFVITTAERARDLPNSPAYVIDAIAPAFPSQNNIIHSGHSFEWEMQCGREIAHYLWDKLGLKAADIDTANLYDGFSFLTVLWLELLGFCAEGEGFSLLKDGKLGKSAVALNTSGGSLGQGRLHGVSQLKESVLQVMGRAGDRQVPDVDLALATSGFPVRAAVLLLAKSPN